jgi:hypothetical protein
MEDRTMNRSEGCQGMLASGLPRGSRRSAGQAVRPGILHLFVLAVVLLTTGTGCLIPIYSGDPIRRAQQLIFTSEDLRAIADEWERIWFLDQPSHMTPFRTHGGII